MQAKVVSQKGYEVNLEIELTSEEFKEGIRRAYNKEKHRYPIQGFRKGKAPQYLIERQYGESVFYETALNILFPEYYEKAIDELNLFPVDNPSLDLDKIVPAEGVVLKVKVDVKPEVELGDYKGIEIEKIDVKVLAKDVNAALEEEAKKNARKVTVEDRPVKKDDTVTIDFEGFVDGVAFEGGKAEKHQLKIGAGEFIPGFEDQIIGKSTGEEFDVNVTFPKEYHSEDLKGKDAVFKVKLHDIMETELPEMDDEFAKDVSEFDTLEEYKAELKKEIRENRKKQAEESMKNEAFNKAVESAKVDIPKAMIDRRVEGNIKDFGMRIMQQGMELEQYLQMLGMTKEQLEEQYRPLSEKQVKSQLVFEKISLAEKIKATDKEVDEKLEEMSKNYGVSLEDLKKDMSEEYINYIKEGIIYENTIDFVYKNAEKVKTKKETKKKTDTKKKES